MRKKTLSTLVLAGIMAATMVPTAVFAMEPEQPNPTQKTTVGYIPGGNVSPDGKVMVTIPMAVTFQDTETGANFDVDALVYNESSGKYEAPTQQNSLKLEKTIEVKVSSSNAFLLKDTASKDVSKATGKYDYILAKKPDGTTGPQTLNNTSNGTENTPITIGTLKDGASFAEGRYSVDATVQMTDAPKNLPNHNNHLFSDTLTYTFEGLVPPASR